MFMDGALKQSGWSILYYKTIQLVGKYNVDNSTSINIGYPEICLLNIIIQLNSVEENKFCTMKNSNLAKIMCCAERQLQLYLSHLKSIGVVYTFEDRLPGQKNITTKRTIYVDYKKISELTNDKNKIRESSKHSKNNYNFEDYEISGELEEYITKIFSSNGDCLQFSELKEFTQDEQNIVNKVANNILYKDFLKTKYWECVSQEKKMRFTKCQLCGKTDGLQVHHNSYEHHGYEHQFIDEDLTCLCKDCHKLFHK